MLGAFVIAIVVIVICGLDIKTIFSLRNNMLAVKLVAVFLMLMEACLLAGCLIIGAMTQSELTQHEPTKTSTSVQAK